MTISAKVIADSISPAGKRLTTLELRYPRFIHAEFMTHRIFSRNASSSRAIPVERMIQDVLDDPAMPIHWGKNQPGMQAQEEMALENNITMLVPRDYDDWAIAAADLPLVREGYYAPKEDLADRFVIADLKTMDHEMAWLTARDFMIHVARAYATADYHKQIVNRLLEPWLHIRVIVTADEFENFRQLRLHPDAQPEIQELARQMFEARDASVPSDVDVGGWHLPYVTEEDWEELESLYAKFTPDQVQNDKIILDWAKKLSVARCASVSYNTVDGKPMTMERARAIYDKLVKADVFHASPFEHQATPDKFNQPVYDEWGENDGWDWKKPELHGNFTGWIQNRKLMESKLPLE